MARFENKTVIITGGAGGIGLAAGKLFAREGGNVMLVDLTEDALQSAVKAIDGGDRVTYQLADV